MDTTHAFTRKDAIACGDQLCLSHQFPNICEKFYRFPVYCSRAVWELLTSAAGHSRSGGVKRLLWNLLWMSVHSDGRRVINDCSSGFDVVVIGADREPDCTDDDLPMYSLIVRVDPFDVDDVSPTVSILFDDDDDPLPVFDGSLGAAAAGYRLDNGMVAEWVTPLD